MMQTVLIIKNLMQQILIRKIRQKERDIGTLVNSYDGFQIRVIVKS